LGGKKARVEYELSDRAKIRHRKYNHSELGKVRTERSNVARSLTIHNEVREDSAFDPDATQSDGEMVDESSEDEQFEVVSE
jgi:hypothetical protein|tara:strand:+ start:532 stop:774 length:243 start_codon:yes stop_codon:yes gene_type:complete